MVSLDKGLQKYLGCGICDELDTGSRPVPIRYRRFQDPFLVAQKKLQTQGITRN
jgi:hypothetical protein